MLEVCLRSYCYRSFFDICMVHLLSSWCVDMVLHGMWRWFFFIVLEMVASRGITRFLEKVWFMLSFDMLSVVLG